MLLNTLRRASGPQSDGRPLQIRRMVSFQLDIAPGTGGAGWERRMRRSASHWDNFAY
jgi:hypothetical protein